MLYDSSEQADRRGLHLVIIDPTNGKVKSSQVFDTHKSSELLEDFINTTIPEGHIVVAACKEDCFEKLSPKVIKWFADMGSEEIGKLESSSSWAFIGKMGSA